MNPAAAKPLVSVVVIGRNEGMRLIRCLTSIKNAHSDKHAVELIYVDSASTDESVAVATDFGACVLTPQAERPSAALARNSGWRHATGEFILFLDGDTILHADFIAHALTAMTDCAVAVVWGHRREVAPTQSVYVRVLDLDWIYPPGDTLFCGGDALVRRTALAACDGFDDTLIAGEEPEMCSRMRAGGAVIRHIDACMTLHDLAINSFHAYWRRAVRAGHAYAEVAQRCRTMPDRLWSHETRRNLLHGSLLLAFPFLILAATLQHPWAAMTLVCLSTAVIFRNTRQSRWKSASLSTRILYAIHSHFQQIPILFGQVGFRIDRALGRQRGLIEYKSRNPS